MTRNYMSRGKPREAPRFLFVGMHDVQGIATIRDQVETWCRLSRYRFDLFNFWGMDSPAGIALPASLDLNAYDGVLIHCTVSYTPRNLEGLDRDLPVKLRDYRGLKMMMKQDEHYMPWLVADFIGRARLDLVITMAPLSQVAFFYPPARAGTPRYLAGLTGYVTDEMARMTSPSLERRRIDVGYRGSLQHWNFGRLAWEKAEIGERFREVAQREGLIADISSRWEDRIPGTAWFDFLRGVRAVLGVESGASIIDYEGEVERLTQEYLARNPRATFEEIFTKVLKSFEGNGDYRTVSPRHFEAAACRCVQVLYEGDYRGIFVPERHYIPLRRDFRNVDDVVRQLRDLRRCQRMADTAFEEVIAGGRYSYRSFVAEFDAAVGELLASRRTRLQ